MYCIMLDIIILPTLRFKKNLNRVLSKKSKQKVDLLTLDWILVLVRLLLINFTDNNHQGQSPV